VIKLAQGVKEGNKRSLARALTIAENGGEPSRDLLRSIFPLPKKRSSIVGITGAPGMGKSTLISALAEKETRDGRSIAVLAVDPSSPFTGGAILGDRIRFSNSGSGRVFFRSVASRGHTGGLAVNVPDMLNVLEAAGYEKVVLETVGAGQGEVEVISCGTTIVVVVAPGTGDEIQAIKAGILEIADIFVVNKADLDGADKVVMHLEEMLHSYHGTYDWRPRIVRTMAREGKGLDELAAAIEDHEKYLEGTALRSQRLGEAQSRRLDALLGEQLVRIFLETQQEKQSRWQEIKEMVLGRQLDGYSAISQFCKDTGLLK